jgi:hypothetical protein
VLHLGSSYSVPSIACDREAHSESGGGEGGGAGFTVPIATTTSVIADMEEGVEVMSTPTEPHVGLTLDLIDVVKSYYNSYAIYKSFATRIDTSRENKKDNGKPKYLFICHTVGINKKVKQATDGPVTEKKMVPQRRRCHVERTKCPKRMFVRKNYNHDLVTKLS